MDRPRPRRLLLPMVLATLLLGCGARTDVLDAGAPDAAVDAARSCEAGSSAPPMHWRETVIPQTTRKDIDILFVIDNSASMAREQKNLTRNFPKLIDALRSTKLGGRIPDVHIGVVSTDLGVGPYTVPTCGHRGGDGALMQNTARSAGCPTPTDRWISYIEGKTNIPGSGDALVRVKKAFSCIAELGAGGCAFEHPLEAARRALDPQLGLNPGFLREKALLAVIFITDEDDCSAARQELFDPSDSSLQSKLGPLTSYRCFEFGIRCNVNGRFDFGRRKNCKPAYDWLQPVDGYIRFFRQLKRSPDDVLMAAITGPDSPIEVRRGQGGYPQLGPSCSSSSGTAVPPLRLEAVLDAFGGDMTSICTNDFGPALEDMGKRIAIALEGRCVDQPLVLSNGALICGKGDVIGKDCSGREVTCKDYDCLDRADCTVDLVTARGRPQQKRTRLKRCPPVLFADPTIPSKDCGAYCPCWRIVPSKSCDPKKRATSPYAINIMRSAAVPDDTVAVARCRTTTLRWGTPALAALPTCRPTR